MRCMPLRVWGKAFIVSGESPEACGPGEGACYHPSAGQQHEASFGHRVLDDFELDAVLLGGFGGVGPGVALIDEGQLDRRAGHPLHLLGQRRDLVAVPLIGRRYGQRQQVAPACRPRCGP